MASFASSAVSLIAPNLSSSIISGLLLIRNCPIFPIRCSTSRSAQFDSVFSMPIYLMVGPFSVGVLTSSSALSIMSHL
eukprot:12397720-Heterocapsa_arctica.AAC.1